MEPLSQIELDLAHWAQDHLHQWCKDVMLRYDVIGKSGAGCLMACLMSQVARFAVIEEKTSAEYWGDALANLIRITKEMDESGPMSVSEIEKLIEAKFG